MKSEFTHLKVHGSPSELIDRAFGMIEGWLDRYFASEGEVDGRTDVYSTLGRLSLKEKIDLYIPEGVDNLEVEYGSRYIWQEVCDLIALRPEMDSADAYTKLRAWLEAGGWYAPSLDLPRAPEPLLSELLLRIVLDGLLIYLAGWFEGLADVTA